MRNRRDGWDAEGRKRERWVGGQLLERNKSKETEKHKTRGRKDRTEKTLNHKGRQRAGDKKER